MATGQPYDPPVPLEKYLAGDREIKKSRIHLVGVELEGGWDKAPEGARVQRDGSVRTNGVLVGEISFRILQQTEVEGWMKKYYPKYVNDTCGMHVHMSMETALHYMRLMVPEYGGTIVACMTDWAKRNNLPKGHPIWPRLEDRNRYCRHWFCADQQAIVADKDFSQDRDGNRYTAINYCFVRNGTVECRLLPMMETPELGYSAVREVLRITDAFLLATAKKEKKFSAPVIGDDRELPDVYRIEA